MKILSIDTANGACSVALSNDGEVLATKTDNEPSKQAERLFSIINEVLHACDCKYSDINAIAANIGPGSFTGVRIGLSAARGIALAANIPIIGISGLEALAEHAKQEHNCKDLLVVLDARRNQLFTQFFSENQVGEAALLEYDDILSALPNKNPVKIIGSGATHTEQTLQNNGVTYEIISNYVNSDATIISLCAFNKYRKGNYNNNPSPLYIRPPDAKLPNRK